MGFFQDYAEAVESYPDTEVTLEIIDVTVPGNALNVNELGGFRVKVTNRGDLAMTDVSLKVRGLAGTQVKNNGGGATLADEFVTALGQVERVPAHGGVTTTTGGLMGFEAPGTPRSLQDLIEVTLAGWNADVDNILTRNSKASSAVRAAYRDEVQAA